MRIVHRVHDRLVHSRRVRVLHEHLVPMLPSSGSILDVGCGDGLLSSRIAQSLPNAEVVGVDILVRPESHIDVRAFDGKTIPMEDDSVDTVLLVDVLHHIEDAAEFLKETRRVAKHHIVIKDHTKTGLLAEQTLRFMDRVGNAHHGVALPYTYLTRPEWDRLFMETGLEIERWIGNPRLYGFPGDLVFGRNLHFVCRLRPKA